MLQKNMNPLRIKKIRLNRFTKYVGILISIGFLAVENITKEKDIKEVKKIILGAFFGAIYSIVLVGPLLFFVSDKVNNNNFMQVLFTFPVTIFCAYLIINRSIEWMNNNNMVDDKYTLMIPLPKDILLYIALVITACLLLFVEAINLMNATVWIFGVFTIIMLQYKSGPSLVDR